MEELLISDLFRIILKRIKAIILIALLCGSIAIGYCKFIATPEYSVNSALFANNGGIENVYSNNGGAVAAGDVASSLNLLKTYIGLLDEIDFYSKVNSKMIEDGTAIGLNTSQVKNSVTITPVEDTMIISVTVRSANGEFAVDLANTIAELAPEHIKEYISQATAKKCKTAVNYRKVYPNTTMSTLIFAMMGAVVYIVVVVIKELNDNTIKGEDDFFAKYDIPVLGSIPSFEIAKPKKGKGKGYDAQ